MFTSRTRQFSVRTINPAKTTHNFHPSPHKFLPTVSENREFKKNTGKQLTQAISKFTHHNKKQPLNTSEQMLRAAMFVMKSFATVQNNFQNLFEELHEVLKRFCFALNDSEIAKILQEYRIKQGSSYRKTVILMNEELSNIMSSKSAKIKELTSTIEDMNKQSNNKQEKWKQMKKEMQMQIERYKKLANQDYTISLQEETERQKTQIKQMTTQIKLLHKQSEQYLKQIDQKDHKIDQMEYEHARLKADVFDLTKRLDLNENYFNVLKDRFDGLLVKMMGLKEIIAKVEEENSNLVSDRAQLVSRAAVSFTDLTPRPKYKELLGFELKGHVNSTADIFANILERSSLQPKEIVEKIILKKKNYKLQQAEAIRQKVVENIIESKQQMRNIQKRRI